MKSFVLAAWLVVSAVNLAVAESSITKSPDGWTLTNGQVQMALTHSGDSVRLTSLRRENGMEWAVLGSPLVASPDKSGKPYHYAGDAVADVPKGAKQLTLRFESESGGVLSLMLKVYPTGAVIEMATKVENHGERELPLDSHIDPLFFTLKNPAVPLKPYSSVKDRHGFQLAGVLAKVPREFPDWIVLENSKNAESVLVGGEPGVGILGWRASVSASPAGAVVRAGTIFLKDKPDDQPKVQLGDKKPVPSRTFELAPGASVETPLSFIALAKGDTDDAGNTAFRYLKQYVFQTPLPDSPLITYCIWLTEKDSEEPLLKELDFAKRMGFDVFYHDATWYEGASVIPGMNDWTLGLGSYQEDKEKFPHGLKNFSDSVHSAGMKFGLWIDPGNVDAARVAAGEIPSDWLAMIDGKTIGTTHPSLAITKQLCLGDPKVVAWVEKQLGDIIEKWHLDWIKWDPSSTVSYECNRTDHGHGKTDGAYAAYKGRVEILRYLMNRFPNLSGFECDPSLLYARTNPGPQGLLPGGYTNEFIMGPMLSPHVWGSLATVGKGDAHRENLGGRWYSASALDYYFRKHFTHGVTFGNVNGMSSQFLSAAPPGFIEAFRRNLLFFKQYRHLLLEDVYHPKVDAAGWSAIQYVKEDSSESVAFVFRDKSNNASATVRLRGLDATAKYNVISLNDRPGRDRVLTGAALMAGVAEKLPDHWLAVGDGALEEFADQQLYGSDVLLLRRMP